MTPAMPPQPDALEALLQWYADLSPESLPRLGEFYAAEARFKDPFNEVRGLAAIDQVFAHMFSSTEQPRFIILDRLYQGDQGFATWRFTFSLQGRHYDIAGASHLRFDGNGKVSEHRDYWDAAEELWQALPWLGPPVRWLRGRFSASRQRARAIR